MKHTHHTEPYERDEYTSTWKDTVCYIVLTLATIAIVLHFTGMTDAFISLAEGRVKEERERILNVCHFQCGKDSARELEKALNSDKK